MANTALFAPQVRSVQPAFELNDKNKGDVYIYFSLSDFNQDVTIKSVECKIIDPNVSAGWGNNSMIIGSSGILSVREINKDSITITLNNAGFKLFTVNQYYQVQLRFETSEDVVSPWSQVTLIRPIPAITKTTIVQNGNILNLNRVEGYIEYADGSTVEAIKSYFVVVKNTNGQEVYRSDLINNTLGTSFATNLYNCFLDDGDYTLYVEYTTINGYSNASKIQNGKEQGNNIHIGLGEDISSIIFPKDALKIENNLSNSSVDIEFEAFKDYNSCEIQRSDEQELFKNWNKIKSFSLQQGQRYKLKDYLISSETVYKYRFVFSDGGKRIIASQYTNKDNKAQDIEALAQIENICLLDEHQQLFIRYNPNISGFKYVTQENLTGTLGGKYPFVRINGDTKYRQFSLSGTLTFKMDYFALNSKGGRDSTNLLMDTWIKNDNNSIIFDADSLFANFTPAIATQAKKSSAYIEKKLRTIAMDFLTNQQPKLFRGMGEDTMIVYLSGVSFTPNKQLSREVWDFSCTVTEIADFNQENLVKYNLQKDSDTEQLMFFLKMQQEKKLDANGSVLEIIDYIALEDTIDGIPILYSEWMKMQGD